MTRIALYATALIFAGLALLLWPLAFDYIGDITLHAALLFEVWPALFLSAFIGTIAEELTD